MAVDLTRLIPGDELVVLDTSNGRELKAYYRNRLPSGELSIYIERFSNVMRFTEYGVTGLGRFKIDRKV